MGPTVADVEKLVDEAARRLAQDQPEDFRPLPIHEDQQHSDVVRRFALALAEPGVRQDLGDNLRPALSQLRFHLALDERAEAVAEQLHRLADALMVSHRHAYCERNVPHWLDRHAYHASWTASYRLS